ncbi:DUF6236 family protein [Acinetobacter pittii]|uniref:DUF6236 family protein n=1 Tax=Acinetobacter pittii TaxID=48296 RepID=UPI0024DF06AD|nr:DUF6236 family protein [Acinetobacter pittii]
MNKIEIIESILLDLKENRQIVNVILSFEKEYNDGMMNDLPYEARNNFYEFFSDFKNNKKYIRNDDLEKIYYLINNLSNHLDEYLSNNSGKTRTALLTIINSMRTLPNIKTFDFLPVESFSQKNRSKNSQYIDRGILLYPGNMQATKNGFTLTEAMSQVDMFYYALYWDKIVVSSSVVNVDLPCDLEFMRQGVLEKLYSLQYPKNSPYKSGGKIQDFASHELWVFGDVASEKLRAEGEDWTISHINSDPIYDPEHTKEQNTIRLRLTNALPFPAVTEENNVERLLNFKLNRAPELAALHESMDTLVKRIYEEPLHALKEREIKRFENAVNELDKTLIERFKIIRKSDWEIALNWDPVNIVERIKAVGSVIVPAIAADHFSPVPIFTSAVGLTSLFSLNKKYAFTFNRHAQNDIKLEYISGAKSKKIIT